MTERVAVKKAREAAKEPCEAQGVPRPIMGATKDNDGEAQGRGREVLQRSSGSLIKSILLTYFYEVVGLGMPVWAQVLV